LVIKRIKIRVKIHKINCSENVKSMLSCPIDIQPIFTSEINAESNSTSNSNSNSKSNTKTKKKKTVISQINKAKLWEIFDVDIKGLEETDDAVTVKCLYDVTKEQEVCKLCDSNLMIMDNGFPTCTNKSCCVIYKDILDYSPEWRFYGTEDKNAADPTRCGNPINPLLVESSFGCKVLCNKIVI